MRRLIRFAMVAGLLGAGYVPGASADPIVNLTFQGSGLASIELMPGQTAVMDLVLINDVELITATFGIRVDSGPATITDALTTPPAPLGPLSVVISPPTEAVTFGGLALVGSLGPGTYDLGDVTFTAGIAPGVATISPFQRAGIDEWYDLNFNTVIPLLGTAVITVVPEPSTLSLVGFGLVALVARRRAAG